MFLDPTCRFKKAPYLSDVLRMDVRTDIRNELVKIIREDQSRQAPQDGSSRHAHTNDSTSSSTQDNDNPSHPKRIKLANLLGDILDSPTARNEDQMEDLAEAEI